MDYCSNDFHPYGLRAQLPEEVLEEHHTQEMVHQSRQVFSSVPFSIVKGLPCLHPREVGMLVGEEHSGRILGVALGTCYIAGLADVNGMDYRQPGGLDMRDRILLFDVCLASTVSVS